MKTLATAVLLMFTLNSFAFSVKNHRRITRKVQKEFERLAPKHKMTKVMWQWFSWGTLAEDKEKLIKRVNWHFYDSTNTFHPQESLNNRFNLLIKQLNHQIAEGNDTIAMYETLGRITHFLQDMVVPPHVVPVYHGMFDAFDDYKVNKTGYTLSDYDWRVLELKCKNDTSFTDLLDEYAQNTLNRLKDSIDIIAENQKRRVTWNWFWIASPNHDFGNYGRLGNNFGKTRINIRKAWYNKKKVYDVSATDYCNFHYNSVTDAIKVSIRALLLFEKMLAKQPKKDCRTMLGK